MQPTEHHIARRPGQLERRRAPIAEQKRAAGCWATALILGLAAPLHAQAPPLPIEDLPLAQYGAVARGGSVTPVYEGWYDLPDGGFVLYFGYYNRNTEEVVEVPVGPDNGIRGPSLGVDVGQPTVFEPGRAWGVLGVEVPEDFGDASVVWTVTANGTTTSIPGRLHQDWEVPAIAGDVMGNRPPSLRFTEEGPEGRGPLGVWAAPSRAAVNAPASLTVFASDGADDPGQAIVVTWAKHRGPGEVRFTERSGSVPSAGGAVWGAVTFDRPGTYVLRVSASVGPVRPAGNEQCCWSNGYMEFTVQ